MTTVAEQVRGVEARHVLQVYKRLPLVLVRGEGSRVVDTDGREYVDFLSGIGVASLGHAHTGLAEALAAQARELVHTSNLFFHPLQGQVAARLARLSGLPRAFFCNSGTEAVEACLKFARRYWHAAGSPARTEIVAFERSFHGRTFGSLSVTSGAPYREPFAPLVPGVRFVPPDDPEALRQAVSPATAAVIVEPIQGEGGVWPLSRTMADAISSVCAETGALLVADEIQCGLGRTGHPFYSAVLGLRPDLMALGKALGAGFPVGAALRPPKRSKTPPRPRPPPPVKPPMRPPRPPKRPKMPLRRTPPTTIPLPPRNPLRLTRTKTPPRTSLPPPMKPPTRNPLPLRRPKTRPRTSLPPPMKPPTRNPLPLRRPKTRPRTSPPPPMKPPRRNPLPLRQPKMRRGGVRPRRRSPSRRRPPLRRVHRAARARGPGRPARPPARV